jgi:hypothetical protein
VADAWMPGARCIRSESDGGQMQGGAPRVVWLTLEVASRDISVISAAQRLLDEQRPCHLVWDPRTGKIAQLLPIVRAGCALGTREHIFYEPSRKPQPVACVNREGRLCVQIAVLGSLREPFTSCPMIGLGDILGWLDSWQIPRRWPAGQPAPFRQAEYRTRSRALWARGGHFGASQVPGCSSIGPGGIDIDQLTGVPALSPEPLPSAAPGRARSSLPGRTASRQPGRTRPPLARPLDRRHVEVARDAVVGEPLTAAARLAGRWAASAGHILRHRE